MIKIDQIILKYKIIDDLTIIELVAHNLMDEGAWDYKALERKGVTDFSSDLYDNVRKGILDLSNKTSQELKAFCNAVLADMGAEAMLSTTGLREDDIKNRIAKI
ncbi:MAG: hypothetical protein NVS1B10_07370 [Candidatus Saccharimonadales bacterium]